MLHPYSATGWNKRFETPSWIFTSRCIVAPFPSTETVLTERRSHEG